MRDTVNLPDVTDVMNHYRIVARSVWNLGFWPLQELRNWDSRDQFDQIKALLFKAFVETRVTEGHWCNLANVPEHKYLVVPSDPGPVPVMIHRPREGDLNRYWDDPVDKLRSSDAELHFIDYFDWDKMNYAEFRYYRVRIVDFPLQLHLVGREALIEHHVARVLLG
jgi:hypothetical protein